MRITVKLPDDLHEKIAVDALRKRHNSKEAVITEILRAYYGGGDREEMLSAALGWRVTRAERGRILALRRRMKSNWK